MLARKVFCGVPGSSRRIFTEQMSGLTARRRRASPLLFGVWETIAWSAGRPSLRAAGKRFSGADQHVDATAAVTGRARAACAFSAGGRHRRFRRPERPETRVVIQIRLRLRTPDRASCSRRTMSAAARRTIIRGSGCNIFFQRTWRALFRRRNVSASASSVTPLRSPSSGLCPKSGWDSAPMFQNTTLPARSQHRPIFLPIRQKAITQGLFYF